MTGSGRIAGLDAFRLLGALCVVALHVDSANYPLLSAGLSADVRLLCRWAVPYFFMLTGYLIAHRGVESAIAGSLARAVVVALTANLLLLPYDWYWMGTQATLAVLLDPRVLAVGVQAPMWYLSANVLGLLVVFAAHAYGALRWLAIPAAAAVLLTAVTGAYYPPAGFGFVICRELLGISFLWAGMSMARRTPGPGLSALLIVAGILLQWLEARLLSAHWGSELRSYEFLLGTVPLSVGVFGLASAWRPGPLLRFFGSLGARYALGVYVLHPYFLNAIQRQAAAWHWRGRPMGALLLASAFAATLAAIWLVDRLWPRAVDLLAGDPRAWRRSAGRATERGR